MTYTTAGGEVRTTVSARLTGIDLDRLDQLVAKLTAEQGRPASRSDALRAALAAATDDQHTLPTLSQAALRGQDALPTLSLPS
ncbi:MAG: hypothetical protein LC798_12180 [Chloroflexi bacterium]|nr:hypothetical protein [Chloroflexota bacterium]